MEEEVQERQVDSVQEKQQVDPVQERQVGGFLSLQAPDSRVKKDFFRRWDRGQSGSVGSGAVVGDGRW